MKNCWIGVSIGGSKGALGTPPRPNFFNFHAVFWQKSCIIKICMKMRTFGGQHLLLKIHDKQECIPVGCVPPACCPYLPGVGVVVPASGPGGFLPLVPGGYVHPLRCGPQVWAWRPPPRWVWAWRPHTSQTPQPPSWVWAWRPARHARIPPPPPVDRQTRVKT